MARTANKKPEIQQLKSYVCRMCGKAYGSLKGNFPVSYQQLYHGSRYIPYCNDCVAELYAGYLRECGNDQQAMRQLCRKLDLYWSKFVFEDAKQAKAKRNIEISYILKLNTPAFIGKSFDDTLREAGTMWENDMWYKIDGRDKQENEDKDGLTYNISDETVAKFGPGYTDQQYYELQTRYDYWLSRLPNDYNVNDVGVQALLVQLCGLELDVNKARASNASTDRSVKMISELVASLGLKPFNKKDDELNQLLETTPLGVWLQRYEKQRPLPELPNELKENRIKRYIFTWLGHVCKMMGVKNTYTKMYEEEVERLRVERPSYDGDEEDLLIDAYTDDETENDPDAMYETNDDSEINEHSEDDDSS